MSFHDGGGMLDTDECRAQKQSDRLVEGVDRDVLDRGEHAGAAGVVVHAIDTAEVSNCQVDGGLYVSFLGHICVKVECVPAQFPGAGPALFIVNVGDENTSTLLNKQSG